jgi:membrane-associated protease RseP (regulator of RpoE activity)
VENVLLFIVGVVIVAVGVLLSIVLHEAGHFIPAKLFKVRVGQFMVGFGKTLWSRKYKGTEFGIKVLPLGGYISMAGMYPPIKPGGKAREASTGFFQTLVQDARQASGDTILPGEDDRTFYRLPIWKRIVVMLGGPIMNLIIGIVLYTIVLVGFGIPAVTQTVSAVPQCVQPATNTSSVCAPSDPASPAAAAGFKPGDTIKSIDGASITSWAQVTSIIQKSYGKTLSIVVLRSGHTETLTTTPVSNTEYVLDSKGNKVIGANGKPETRQIGFIGINATETLVPQSIGGVLPQVWSNTTTVGNIILNLPERMVGVWNAAFSSGTRDPNGPVGVIGVGRIAGQIATQKESLALRFETLLALLASLNIALFVFNLIPLMPLDGGHIVGALWEGIRRFFAKVFRRKDPGPVDTAKVVPLTFAVVIVLGAMSLLLMYADIVNPITLN